MSDPITDPALIQAEAAYRYAQAAYFKAQTAGQEIDNLTATALATSAEIALGREQLKERWDAASNGRNRVLNFTDAVGSTSVEASIDVLSRWQRIDGDDGRPWRFVICSGGGNVVFGMKLFSTLQSIGRTRPIITVASGICASMATVIHQAGTTRLVEPGCSYMIHDVSGEAEGKITDMEDTMAYMKMINHKLHEILANRSGINIKEIEKMGNRKDSWFMPEEVVRKGFADAIGFGTE